ncbi:hypothetical protein ABZ613_32525 [Streptomyces collinus]
MSGFVDALMVVAAAVIADLFTKAGIKDRAQGGALRLRKRTCAATSRLVT